MSTTTSPAAAVVLEPPASEFAAATAEPPCYARGDGLTGRDTVTAPNGGYFAQVRRARLLSVMVFLSGHVLSWQG